MNIDPAGNQTTSRRHVRISKYLSKHLRHEPERLGLELLNGGWIDINKLLIAAAKDGFEFNRSDLEVVVKTSDKQRFAIDDADRVPPNYLQLLQP
jgi:putative RNA 2'-phosphotransferase